MIQEKKDRLLRQWKIRQEAEGHDVSGVHTLEEAEHFFDKPKKKKKTAKKPKSEEATNTMGEETQNSEEGEPEQKQITPEIGEIDTDKNSEEVK